MRTRLLATATVALLSAGCAGVTEAVAPRYFYGNLAEEPGEELCLSDPRDDEPDRTRCFVLEGVEVPAAAGVGDLLAVRYRLAGEEREAAVHVRVVEDR